MTHVLSALQTLAVVNNIVQRCYSSVRLFIYLLEEGSIKNKNLRKGWMFIVPTFTLRTCHLGLCQQVLYKDKACEA